MAPALQQNTIGGGNVATGGFALTSNTTGVSNTAEGFDALFNNTTGSRNTGVGLAAGSDLTTGNDNIDIGNRGVAAESGTIRIGTSPTQTRTFIAGTRGVAIAGANPVGVSATGQLGVAPSSARFKKAIKPMDKASEVIHSLEPVTFRYREELDPEGIPQFGLVAEEVAKVNPALVARDNEGKPYTVRYEAVNAMLLNEFLKEHRRVEEQTCINQQQEVTIARLEAALSEQGAQIQKVGAQLAAVQTGARLVTNE